MVVQTLGQRWSVFAASQLGFSTDVRRSDIMTFAARYILAGLVLSHITSYYILYCAVHDWNHAVDWLSNSGSSVAFRVSDVTDDSEDFWFLDNIGQLSTANGIFWAY